jgi:hypothetical protein
MLLVTLGEKFTSAVLLGPCDQVISITIQFRKVSWRRARITVPTPNTRRSAQVRKSLATETPISRKANGDLLRSRRFSHVNEAEIA